VTLENQAFVKDATASRPSRRCSRRRHADQGVHALRRRQGIEKKTGDFAAEVAAQVAAAKGDREAFTGPGFDRPEDHTRSRRMAAYKRILLAFRRSLDGDDASASIARRSFASSAKCRR
jgi:hypothetical protein